MPSLCVVVLVVLLSAVQLARPSPDVRMPPKIIAGPIRERIYRSDDSLKLTCLATGTRVEYTWKKNGQVLGPQSNIQYVADGMEISPLSTFDEGYYQCEASNQYGVSLSNTSVLQRAIIGTYSTTQPVEYHNLEEGQPFVLRYSYVKCFPAPTFTWYIAESAVDNAPALMVTSKRVQIDEEGNLHFSYLLAGDVQNGKLYKCNVLNPHLDLTVGGSYSRLYITPKGVKEFAPVRAFASSSPVIAVIGRNVTLRCFFSGYPDPTLAWSRRDGTSLPAGRYKWFNFNTEFVLSNIQQSDEGDYLCRAVNTIGQRDEIIQIDVQSEPFFENPERNRPSNRNATEGETIVFTCNATAEPIASIGWLRNGEVLTSSNMPERMRFTSSGKQLVIENVCKECSGGNRTSDLMVIQCNASNIHGYVFTDAYVNVLKRTVITDKPVDVHLAFNETSAEFLCAATSDDSTPLIVSWFRVVSDSDQRLVRNNAEVTVSSDGSRLSIQVPEDRLSVWPNYRGQYRCFATNGYSNESATCTLTVDDPPPPVAPIIIVDDSPTAATTEAGLLGASLSDLWWLWIIIAVVFLLIIIIVCICCFCCKKGDTYYVDKKERKDHKDPEKELIDNAIQPYHRKDDDPLKGSRASLGGYSMKSDSDDDDDDLNEYGDIDAGKFTEDGSFIGDYATDNKRHRGRQGDSFA